VGRYIIRRLLINIPVLLGITILVFVFTRLTPGDPVLAYMSPELGRDQAMVDRMRKQMGLDQPYAVQYVRWLGKTLQGDLGYRIVGGQSVGGTLLRVMRASGLLMGTALALGCLIGIPLGIFSALRQYSRLDFLMTTVAFLGVSTPSFLLGLGGLYIFGLKLKLFPIGGIGPTTGDVTIFDTLHHLALPAMILGFGYIAILMRYTRSSMLEVVRATYITTAKAKGLRERVVVFRHAFRNALIPILTIIGLALPEMVGGAVITETVFTWPGMGSLLIDSVNGRDYSMLMGISLSVAVAVLVANLITDIAYAYADPRIRFG
jgi:peptide/nickel transport system permease protein